MDKIKRIITAHVPIDKCNFRCQYCYIAHRPEGNYSPNRFKYSAQQIRKALSKKRMGGVCYINLCGDGETLIPVEIIDITRELLEEGHFVEIVTNGSITARINQLLEFPPELLKRLAFKVSFHYEELVRLGLLDTLFNNFNRMLDAGCSAYLEMVATDSLIPLQKEIYDLCVEKAGAPCHLTIERDDQTPEIKVKSKYDLPEYEYMWKDFDCEMMRFKASTFYRKREEFCYAGDWSLYVSIGDGTATQCYNGHAIFNIFDNPDEPLPLFAIGNNCNCAHCYNSHAFLTWGAIPELESPTYAQMRDRIRTDGRHWLSKEAQEFFSGKLVENNNEYTPEQKKKVNRKNYIYKHRSQNSAFKLVKLGLYTLMQNNKVAKKEKEIKKITATQFKRIKTEAEAKRKNGKIFWIMNTPIHGNLGDQAIVYAQHSFLHKLGYDNIIEISERDYTLFADEIKSFTCDEDVIIIDGGGNLGTLWPDEHKRIEEIIKDYPENKIIIFPQTIYYPDNGYGWQELEKAKKVFDGHNNLTVFLRDEKSYNFFRNSFRTSCAFVPDIVLSLDNVIDTAERNDVLLCLRKDKEKVLSDENMESLEKQIRNLGASVKYISTVLNHGVEMDTRNQELADMWKEFSSARLVITDRLHGMIFCAVTNTPCIALDNKSKKVSGVYKWIEKCDFIYFVDRSIPIELIKDVITEEKNYSYTAAINNFKPLVDVLKD